MKKTILMLLLTVAVLTSCKKDKKEDLIIGKWIAKKEISREYRNDVMTYDDTHTYTNNDLVLEFNGSELKLIYKGTVEETINYTLNGEQIVLKNGDGDVQNGSLRWNSNDEIVLTLVETETSNGVNYRYFNETTLARQ